MNARTAVNVHVKTVRAGTGFPNHPARHPPDVADRGRLQPRLPPAGTETADPLATPDPTAQTRPGARHHPGWAPPPGGNPHVARPTMGALLSSNLRHTEPGRRPPLTSRSHHKGAAHHLSCTTRLPPSPTRPPPRRGSSPDLPTRRSPTPACSNCFHQNPWRTATPSRWTTGNTATSA